MRRSYLSLFALALVACDSSTAPPTPSAQTNPAPVSSTAPSASVVAKPSAETMRPGRGGLRVTAEETRLRIELPDGRVLAQNELPGVILTVRDESNEVRRVRIDKVVTDPKNADLTMYELSAENPSTHVFGNFCSPGPDGLQLAFALSGTWTSDGRHQPSKTQFNMTCTSGAIGKCVRFGYRPWESRQGVSLWDHHQACVRMVRGDYCGDGHAFTRDGMLINLYDTVGIQQPDPGEPSTFEAGWSADGALCVHHPRVPENVTLAELEARCPSRLRGHTGDSCTEDSVRSSPALRMMNRSKQQ